MHKQPPTAPLREPLQSQAFPRLILAAFIVLWLVVAVNNAWLCDDAYITFRTIDNWLNGYGLRWNVAERVQTYTHPLWLFLLTPVVALTGEFYYGTLILSLALSAAAVALIVFRVPDDHRAGCLAAVALLTSKAFVDFSTSGLENPLSYVLLTVFYSVFLRWRTSRKQLAALSILAALGALTRMDSILLYAPPLVAVWWRQRSWQATALVTAGILPLIAWELFAILYYGTPFPNTAYAKVFNFEIPLAWQIEHGLMYIFAMVRVDLVTGIVLGSGLLCAIVSRKPPLLLISLGICLHLVYVVKIGGDFMVGRFMAPAVCGSVVILSRIPFERRHLALVALLAVCGILNPYSPLRSGVNYGHNKAWKERPVLLREVALDERGIYYPYTGLLHSLRKNDWPRECWFENTTGPPPGEPCAIVSGRVGLFGFKAGPDIHVVDRLALGDPLLARLPSLQVKDHYWWMAGHCERVVPAGYLETVATGTNMLDDKELARYYDHLNLVISGGLLDRRRLKTIAALNLGCYDHLIDRRAYHTGHGVPIETKTVVWP